MRDKHQIIEEPCEVKISRTVLKTSGSREGLAEFNHLAAVSNGKLFPNPRPFRKLERKRKHCCNKEYRERLRGQTIARKHKSKSVNYTRELQIPGKTTIGYWHIISVIGQE